MTLTKLGIAAAFGSLLTFFSYNAASNPNLCDVTLETNCADALMAMSGNDDASVINSYWPTNWTQVFKTDGSSSGSFGGIDFSMTGAAPGSTSGNFVLNWSASPASLLPKTLDMVFTLKATNYHAAFLFDDEVITNESGGDPGTGDSSGTWEITFGANGDPTKPIPDLSHLGFYLRNADGTNPPQQVPVPGTLLLVGLGLLGFGFPRYKRRSA